MEMFPPKVKSPAIHSFGFIGDGRGRLRVQFKDRDDNLTSLGDYLDTPRQLYNALRESLKPEQFIATQVKPHFTWVRLNPVEEEDGDPDAAPEPTANEATFAN